MDHCGFADIRRFRVRLPHPLYPYYGREFVAAGDESTTMTEASGWRTIEDLAEFFPAKFEERNPLNIPGPLYGAATDTCLTGPQEAPSNILVDRNGQEFVFRQPETPAEFRDVVSAAICECFSGYGANGNAYWRLSTIRNWWQTRGDMLREGVGLKWCQPEAVEFWTRALQGDATGYLKVYAFFVEHGRPPMDGDTLPEMD